MTTKLWATNRSPLMGFLLFLAACCVTQAGTLGVLTYNISGGEVTITDCKEAAAGDLIIPEMIEGKPVTSIGSFAFNRCSSLTGITLSSRISSIGNRAFQHCEGLLSIDAVTGNRHYTSVDGVLFNANRTELIIYPKGKPDTTYSIPSGVTIINSNAFESRSLLTNITFPAGLTSIGDSAFENCNSLINITLPSELINIGLTVFLHCSSLTDVTFSDGMTGIGFSMFNGCSSLTNITFPAGLTHIDDYAFSGCSSLMDITLPPKNISFGHAVFVRCSSLTNITISSEVTSIGSSMFSKCTSLTDITLPARLTNIGRSAFYSCTSLTNITLPSGVTDIDNNAFYGCSSLTDIVFPVRVSSIDRYAFSHCSELSAVLFLGDAPTAFNNGVFDEVESGFKIYYLSGSIGFTSPTWNGYPTQEISNESEFFIARWLTTHRFDNHEDLDQDLNGDGVTLLMAYALNLDPNTDLSGSLPKVEVVADAMSMTFYAASPGITYILKTSTDLKAWTATGVSLSEFDPENFRTATTDLTASHRFLRLRVEM